MRHSASSFCKISFAFQCGKLAISTFRRMGLEDFKGMRCCYIPGQIVPVSNGVWNKNFKGELLK